MESETTLSPEGPDAGLYPLPGPFLYINGAQPPLCAGTQG